MIDMILNKMVKEIKIISSISFIFCSLFAHAQVSGISGERTFYIVRHAEKDTGNDPVLTMAGLKRAGDLYRKLKSKQLDKIYTTKYRRSEMTADSLRIYSDIDTVQYAADTTGIGLQQKMNGQKGRQKNILIIAHSNTIPAIIRALGVTNFGLKEIPENEFDNLYIITQTKKITTVQHKKYGASSTKVNKENKMKPLQ